MMLVFMLGRKKEWIECAVRKIPMDYKTTENILHWVRAVAAEPKNYEQTYSYQPDQRRKRNVKPD